MKKALGVDFSDYNIRIDSNDIRHIIDHHGDPIKEARKGQIAVTNDNLSKITATFDKPDLIEWANNDSRGRQVIKITKKVDGVYYTFEAYSPGKKMLEIETFYIKKSTPGIAHGNDLPLVDQRPKPQTGEAFSNSNVSKDISSVNARNMVPDGSDLPQNVVDNSASIGETEADLWDQLSGKKPIDNTIPTLETPQNTVPVNPDNPKIAISQGRTNTFERSGITDEESKKFFNPEDYTYVKDTNADQLERAANNLNKLGDNAYNHYTSADFDPKKASIDDVDSMMMLSKRLRDEARGTDNAVDKARLYAESKKLSINSVRAASAHGQGLQAWSKWADTPEHVIDKGYGVMLKETEDFMSNNKRVKWGISDISKDLENIFKSKVIIFHHKYDMYK